MQTLADLGMDADQLDGPLTKIRVLKSPPERKAGIMIQGDSPEAQAAELVRMLHAAAKVI